MPNFVPDSGPLTAQTLIIGEAPGRDEDRRRRPFLGRAGMRLTEFTKAAKVDRIKELRITNTWPWQPPNNNLSLIPLADRERQLQVLYALIKKMPNLRLIVPMGAYALNAVLPERPSTITNLRGSIYPKGKHLILPMVHPALTLYEDTWTRAAIHDWKRARLLMDDPTAYKPLTRDHEIMPSLARVKEYLRECRSLGKKDCLAIDIETPVKITKTLVGYFKNGKPKYKKVEGAWFIASIAFSLTRLHSLTVPLTRSYWGRSLADAWDLVEQLCGLSVAKCFHNGMFDTWHLDRVGITVRNWLWDTKDMHHCLTGDARVLTNDLTWKRLDQVNLGDHLLSFDEEAAGGHRKLRTSIVTRIFTKKAETYEVLFSNGETLCGTLDHKFLVGRRDNQGRANGGVWKEMRDLQPHDEVWSIGRPWASLNDRDSGWLAGFFDGEGSTNTNLKVSVTQKPGRLLRKTRKLLDKYGFLKHYEYESTRATNLAINGGLGESLRFLGSVRPTRLLARARALFEKGVGSAQKFRGVASVVSIKPVGTQRVYDVSTTTKTFIANGIFVHNCLDPWDKHSLGYCASVDTWEPFWKDEGKVEKGMPLDLERYWTYNGKDAAVTRELWWKYKVRLSKIEIREPQAQDWWETTA